MHKSNYYIITGTPGTGKTTLLSHLQAKGFHCIPEITREILSEQLSIDGPGLPAKNPLLFVQMMLKRAIEYFESAQDIKEPVFFDRGIPDLVAYARRFNVDAAEFDCASQRYLYNQQVFILPPWKEIFVNDNERRLTYDVSQTFHDMLRATYQGFKSDLVDVPKVSVEDRVRFVLETVRNTERDNR